MSCFVLFCLVLRFSFSCVSPKDEKRTNAKGFWFLRYRISNGTCSSPKSKFQEVENREYKLDWRIFVRYELGPIASKIVACIVEKCEEIRSFPQFLTLTKWNLEIESLTFPENVSENEIFFHFFPFFSVKYMKKVEYFKNSLRGKICFQKKNACTGKFFKVKFC